MAKLMKNKEWLDANKPSLLETYKNKFVVVVDQKVVGSFDHYNSAANFAIENFGIEGDFLIELLSEEEPVNFVLAANF